MSSIYWPGTTIVRSTCNAFDLSTAARLHTESLLRSQDVTTRPQPIGKRRRQHKTGDTKVAKLLAELATGPKTSAELQASTGIASPTVSVFLETDIRIGTVLLLRMKKPRLYALAKADS